MALVPYNGGKTKKKKGITKEMRQLALQAGLEMVPYGKIVRDVAIPLGKAAYKAYMDRESAAVTHPGIRSGGIAAPVAVSRRVNNKKPRFTSAKGSITVTHRELIASVANTTGALTVNNGITITSGASIFAVNPSNVRLFSWLPSIASNFDEYRVDGLTFIYVPSCATTETGRIVQYWDKDPVDPTPIDRAELSAYAHMSSCAPWAEDYFSVPKDGKWRFCKDVASTDSQLVNFGQYGFAVYGGGSTNITGDVYVSYSVTFREPQPTSEQEFHVFGTSNTSITFEGQSAFASVRTPTATSIEIGLPGPGSYQIIVSADTTVAVPVVTNVGISLASSYFTASGTQCLVCTRVVSPGFTVSTVTITGLTLMTKWNVFVIKCDRRLLFV
jgi:hypothetical protein